MEWYLQNAEIKNILDYNSTLQGKYPKKRWQSKHIFHTNRIYSQEGMKNDRYVTAKVIKCIFTRQSKNGQVLNITFLMRKL